MSDSSESKELSVFEDIRRDLDLKRDFNQFKVPMNYVFNKGELATKESFGGLTFGENSKKVDFAIQNMEGLQNIWNHSHTQWTWKHINMSYHSVYKNMRQIAAEVNGKKMALNEAKWRHVENQIKLGKAKEELNGPNLDYWREVELKVKVAKLQEGQVEAMNAIEGAMKDVLALEAIYEQLKNRLSDFSEEDVEKEETEAHLKRSVVQSIRDVRQYGSISKGEQEYLEQIGVNPTKMQHLLREYVKAEAQENSWSVKGLFQFVDQLVKELIEKHQVDKVRMDLQGFDHEPIGSITYDKKVALLEKQEEEK